jgi:radical SAM protein with 4Fe4S-binding SPASM domain
MHLQFQGEPLLHRNFHEMVKIAKKLNMRTQVFTNGLLLNELLADRLIDAGLDLMVFSVDGASEEIYQKNRVGGNFSKIYKNIEMMVRKAKGTSLNLKWHFIAMRNNEHEIGAAQKLADDIGVEFVVKLLSITDPNLCPSNPEYIRRLRLKPCTDIYFSLFVCWNGDVVMCCFDTGGKYILGNLEKSTLDEVWNSPKYIAIRQKVNSSVIDPVNEPEICRSCLRWGQEPFRTSDGKHDWG